MPEAPGSPRPPARPEAARVRAVIEELLPVVVPTLERAEVSPASRFKEDLGVDSLSMIELVIGLEHRLDLSIPDGDLKRLLTVSDLVAHVSGASAT